MTDKSNPAAELYPMVKRLRERAEALKRWQEGLRDVKDDFSDLELWFMGDAMDHVFDELEIEPEVSWWLMRKMVLAVDPTIRNILVALATDRFSSILLANEPDHYHPGDSYMRGRRHEWNLQRLRNLYEQEEKSGEQQH